MTIKTVEQSLLASANAPWDLSLIPGYHETQPVKVVYAEQLSEADFYRNYVAQNRPCLVKGAATHWLGFKNWKSVAYLKRVAGGDSISARGVPDPEFRTGLAPREKMRFAEFLDRATNHSDQLVVHSIPLRAGGPLAKLLGDIGNYSFLPKPPKPREYVDVRAFFYRNSYTDWHYHTVDETLMTQVVGTKEVMLLPPDDHCWNALEPVAHKLGHLYANVWSEFPGLVSLRPFRAIVEAGDALYIPVYWWHAVASMDDQFGVTVAKTFGTPLHVAGDLRFPLARALMKHLLRTRMFPLGLAAIMYSYGYRLLGPFRKRQIEATSQN